MDLSNLANPYIASQAGDAVTNNNPLRTRKVTLSPAEEYAARAGNTETIPDALASLILCRKAFVEAGAKGVTINRKDIGGKRRYWHPDSIVCNRIGSGEKLKVIAIWNSLDTDIIHLMTAEGRYIESLPSETMPAMLDNAALSKELASHRRVHQRHHEHLQRLHADDSLGAVESARANTAEIQRAITIIPTADTAGQRDAESSDLATAVDRGQSRVKQGQVNAANVRREAAAILDRPKARQTEPLAEIFLNPYDID